MREERGASFSASRAVAAALVGAALLGLGGASAMVAGLQPVRALADEGSESGWSEELDCGSCHEMEYETVAGDGASEVENKAEVEGEEARPEPGETASDKEPEASADDESAGDTSQIDHYAAMHYQSLGVECLTCHENNRRLAAAHKKMDSGKVADHLKRTSVGNEVCLTCHDQGSLAEATKDVKVLTDSRGTTVNPHDLPDVEDHAEIACVSCHIVHNDEDAPIAQSAQELCESCHHAGVYECGTCH